MWSAKTPRFTNTGTVRHGTVTPLALREWNRIQGTPNPDVATTTDLALPGPTVKEGDVVTATVRAADGYETGGRVRFTAPGWEQIAYLDDGVASVTLPGTLVPGEQAVRAEYLGHEFLTASQDTESVTVLRTRVTETPRRRDRPGDVVAVVGRCGDVQSVHAGRGAHLRGRHDGERDLDGG